MKKEDKRGSQNGINLLENIRMNITIRSGMPWGSFFRLFLIASGTYGIIFTFIDAFDLEADILVFIGAILVITAIIETLLYVIGKTGLSLIIPFAPAAFLTYLFKNDIAKGWNVIKNAFIENVNEYYSTDIEYDKLSNNENTDITVICILIAFILIILNEVALNISGIGIMALMPGLFCVAAVFFVGIIPPFISFAFYTVYLFMFVIMERNQSENRSALRERGFRVHSDIVRMKPAMITGIIIILLMVTAAVIFPKKVYEKEPMFKEIKQVLQDRLSDIRNNDISDNISDIIQDVFGDSDGSLLFDSNTVVGGLSGGKLRREGKIKLTNEVKLKLTIPDCKKEMYLRGFTGVNYTGEEWSQMDSIFEEEYTKLVSNYNDTDLTAINLPAVLFKNIEQAVASGMIETNLRMLKSSATVEHINLSRKYTYVPYDTVSTSVENYQEKQDYYLSREKKYSIYHLDYYFSDDFSEHKLRELTKNTEGIWLERDAFEKAYREFVYNIYTMPSAGEPACITEIADELNQVNMSDEDKINAVKVYLAQNNEYTLDPGNVPEGKDYVEYFLTENHKGYCAHFASSAVLLLRRMGIPARYTEGYVITPQAASSASAAGRQQVMLLQDGKISVEDKDSITIEVRDTSAHAWAEVYIDGFGWFPVEMTAGYYQEEITPDDTEVANPPIPTKVPEQSASPTPVVQESKTTESKQIKDINNLNKPENEEHNSRIIIIILCIVCIIAILIMILWMQYHIRSRIWKDRIAHKQHRRVIFIYREVNRLLYNKRLIVPQYGNNREMAKNIEDELHSNNLAVEGISYETLLLMAYRERFGNGQTNEEEEKRAGDYLRILSKNICNSYKGIKKIYFKLFIMRKY